MVVGDVGRASVALPRYIVTGGGAQVAPQRCPILRTGANSILGAGLPAKRILTLVFTCGRRRFKPRLGWDPHVRD
jgi:hypothetical protein